MTIHDNSITLNGWALFVAFLIWAIGVMLTAALSDRLLPPPHDGLRGVTLGLTAGFWPVGLPVLLLFYAVKRYTHKHATDTTAPTE